MVLQRFWLIASAGGRYFTATVVYCGLALLMAVSAPVLPKSIAQSSCNCSAGEKCCNGTCVPETYVCCSDGTSGDEQQYCCCGGTLTPLGQ